MRRPCFSPDARPLLPADALAARSDTKISNVLFDLASGSALCVVDLDTVMSGSLLHDFGDLCRSVCSLCPEDGMGPDGEMLSPEVDEGLFRAVCSGFIDGAGAVLSDLESELLVLSAQVSLSTAVCRPFSLSCVFTPMSLCCRADGDPCAR